VLVNPEIFAEYSREPGIYLDMGRGSGYRLHRQPPCRLAAPGDAGTSPRLVYCLKYSI
jgi:hypothetical protein